MIVKCCTLCYRFFLKGTSFKKDTKIDDKVVIVTGANSGIGKETAIDLAKRGAKVYIGCRDTTRGEEALKAIKKKSGSSKVYFLQLDLASLESVKQFVKKFLEVESQLHILVNNAGVMACPKALTVDGFEMQLGTNHLGHFHLTSLLLDVLKASAPSRVVVVSGSAHKYGTLNKEDLNSENSYSRIQAFCQSKLANNLFTHELARRLQGTGVTANCLNPGIVVTNITRHFISSTKIKYVLDPIASQIVKTPAEGAQTSICLAVDPYMEKVTGKYFSNCKEIQPSDDSRNDELACWLWKKSEELIAQISV